MPSRMLLKNKERAAQAAHFRTYVLILLEDTARLQPHDNGRYEGEQERPAEEVAALVSAAACLNK